MQQGIGELMSFKTGNNQNFILFRVAGRSKWRSSQVNDLLDNLGLVATPYMDHPRLIGFARNDMDKHDFVKLIKQAHSSGSSNCNHWTAGASTSKLTKELAVSLKDPIRAPEGSKRVSNPPDRYTEPKKVVKKRKVVVAEPTDIESEEEMSFEESVRWLERVSAEEEERAAQGAAAQGAAQGALAAQEELDAEAHERAPTPLAIPVSVTNADGSVVVMEAGRFWTDEDIEELDKEIHDLKLNLASKDTKIDELKKQLTVVSEKKDKDMDALKAENGDLHEEVKVLKAENDELKKKVQAAPSDVTSMLLKANDDLVAELRAVLAAKDDLLAELRAQLAIKINMIKAAVP